MPLVCRSVPSTGHRPRRKVLDEEQRWWPTRVVSSYDAGLKNFKRLSPDSRPRDPGLFRFCFPWRLPASVEANRARFNLEHFTADFPAIFSSIFRTLFCPLSPGWSGRTGLELRNPPLLRSFCPRRLPCRRSTLLACRRVSFRFFMAVYNAFETRALSLASTMGFG